MRRTIIDQRNEMRTIALLLIILMSGCSSPPVLPQVKESASKKPINSADWVLEKHREFSEKQ